MKQEFNLNIITKVLNGTATPFEKEEFEYWLNQSDDNKKLVSDNKLIWSNLENIYSHTAFDKEKAKRKVEQTIVSNSKNRSKEISRKIRYIGVAAAASILLLFAFWLAYPTTSFSQVYMANNELMEIKLPDSTHVWLNKNSSLSVVNGFNKNERKVVLSGEAFFEVAHNKQRPFSIETGKTTTKVLGTSFNIFENLESGQVEVVVVSGKVSFNKRGKLKTKQVLTEGKIGFYNPSDNSVEAKENNNRNFLSWRSKELIFQDTPINEVFDQLAKHYEIEIVNNIVASDYALTGKFKNEEIEDILNTIALTFDLQIAQDDIVYRINASE